MKVRFEWVDSIRGLAAISVLLAHFWESFFFPYHQIRDASGVWYYLHLALQGGFNFGKFGIGLFFLVSGFLVPYSISRLNGAVYQKFLVGRFFRLYPAYWVAILLFLLVSMNVDWTKVLFNLTMFQRFFGVEDLVGVFWTLQIEWIFYVVCLAMFRYRWLDRLSGLKLAMYFFIFSMLALSFARMMLNIKLPVAVPLALSLMFFGALCREYLLAGNGASINWRSLFVLIACLFPVCLMAYGRDYGRGETWYLYFFSYVAAILLFVAFANRVVCASGVLGYFGKISYSLYLIHPIYIEFCKNYGAGVSQTYDGWVLACFGLLVVVTVSHVIYKYVESPAIDFGRRYINSLR